MFTGIIETLGRVVKTNVESGNVRLTIHSEIASELKVDQSISHNGVCLTVVAIQGNEYEVIAVDETLKRTNLGKFKSGDEVNLERCMRLGDRLDGHIVQGHVDTTAIVKDVVEADGSWMIYFEYKKAPGYITVQKGSICVNGVSLTVVDSGDDNFSVTIIPYTWEHTNFHAFRAGTTVNLEFDIIGKYVARLLVV